MNTEPGRTSAQGAVSPDDGLVLAGLDGANPLAFLAALGALRLLDEMLEEAGIRMHWRMDSGAWRPVLTASAPVDKARVCQALLARLQEDIAGQDAPLYLEGDIIACPRDAFRERLAAARNEAESASRVEVDFLSGFASEMVFEEKGKKKDEIRPTPFSFANGQSERKLLADYREMVVGAQKKSGKVYAALDEQRLHKALFSMWTYDDDHKEFRWSPSELRYGALSPTGGTVHAANVLAFWALSLLPTAVRGESLEAVGFGLMRTRDGGLTRRTAFTWPVWSPPLVCDCVRSLLMQESFRFEEPDPAAYRELGVECLFRSHRITYQNAAGETLSESLTAAYRALHSLKGNAGFMGFADIERLTHRMETALDSMRSGEIPPDADNVGILLSLLDVLRQAARSAAEEEREDIENCEVYVELLEDSMPALRQVADSPPVAAAEVRSAGDGGQSPGETAATKSAPRRTRQDVRVDIAKLDALVNLVGELVIAEAMVTRHPHVAEAAIEGLDRAVHMLRRVSSDLQDVAMSTRMVPLTATFRKMIRLVHDLAGKAGKQIELQLLGEETEVDKTVIEQITDPLIHIVRNAADHGIEAPDERRAAGKGEQAMITIEGRHEGGEVWILITDDGRGLDRQKILRKAKENGLVAGEAEEWPDSRVFRLIFEPGFSTAEQVTDISGRGVGMDVVKKNLERLNGKIDVRSAPGRGSTFVMRIPLTMAIIEGMLVRVGSARYTVPMLAIRESFRPEPGWITTTPDGQEAVRLREDFYPVLRLHERFAKPPDSPRLEDGILVLVEGEQQTIALFVDEILGQQETVIKGLSQFLVDSEGVSGCTILGDGEVSLILDIAGLVSERAMAAR